MGVIDSFSAGYRFLGRRFDLLLIPIVLDLLLWLGPRLSIAPLFGRLADFYRFAAGSSDLPSDLNEMSRQVADLLADIGANSNLLTNLAGSAFMHTPSLLVTAGGLARGASQEIDSFAFALILFLVLSVAGLLVGVIYLNQLARVLPIGSSPKAAEPGEFMQTALRHWGKVTLYVALFFTALLIIIIPLGLIMGLVSLLSPALASLLVFLLSGAVMVLSLYLYFVTVAIVVDDLSVSRAVMQSFTLVRNNFWATLGFILLFQLITAGFSLIMGQIAATSAIGTLLAIPFNAYIGSGLALALLVFYRTRILKHEELARFADAS